MATAVSVARRRARPASHRAADHGSGRAAEQEAAAGQPVAGPDGVELLDVHDLVHVGLVEQRRPDARCPGRGSSGGRTRRRR